MSLSQSSPLSPEIRHQRGEDPDVQGERVAEQLSQENLYHKIKTIIERTAVGVYSDGFTFAGNFAYLSLLAVFAFFIVAAAIAGSFGQTATGTELVNSFFATLPPSVAVVLIEPIKAAMTARTGPLLWFSAIISLWTITSLVETIREILHRAYGVPARRPFWEYRLGSIGLVISLVTLAIFLLSTQFILAGAMQFLGNYLPILGADSLWLTLSRAIPFIALFISLYLLFRVLTPRLYWPRQYPKWPGAVFISGWWLLIAELLPLFLQGAAGYELTYGSLAGAIITLVFFYLIGLGMVIGAELNAALAERPKNKTEDGS